MNQDTYCGLFEPAGYHSKEELKMLDENYKKYNKGEYHAEYSTYLGNPIVIWNRLKTGEVDII